VWKMDGLEIKDEMGLSRTGVVESAGNDCWTFGALRPANALSIACDTAASVPGVAPKAL